MSQLRENSIWEAQGQGRNFLDDLEVKRLCSLVSWPGLGHPRDRSSRGYPKWLASERGVGEDLFLGVPWTAGGNQCPLIITPSLIHPQTPAIADHLLATLLPFTGPNVTSLCVQNQLT